MGIDAMAPHEASDIARKALELTSHARGRRPRRVQGIQLVDGQEEVSNARIHRGETPELNPERALCLVGVSEQPNTPESQCREVADGQAGSKQHGIGR